MATAASGATVWKKLDNTNLDKSGNPFGANLLHLQERQAAGSSIGRSSGVNATVLNTSATNEISGASLAANQITLPAGTYYADCFMIMPSDVSATGAAVFSKIWLYNVTDSSVTLPGMPMYDLAQNGSAHITSKVMNLSGRFTLAGTKVLEFRYYKSASSGVTSATITGVDEIFADVKIWKIA